MEDRKIVFALDIGTRSVVGVVGALKDGFFSVLDYEEAFHDKRAMRDGQIEDIDLVAGVVRKVKSALEERTGQVFTRVSIAAAGRALKTTTASFSHELLDNEAIASQVVQYMEYSAIESAQSKFLTDAEADSEDTGSKDYYCVGYSVKNYTLDDYQIKNLVGQKGHRATVDIIAAFLPASVLIGLYGVTAACGLEVDNLTLEPIAAIHAVVPDDVRFLNIALVDIGGGTSDIAISKDGSVVAYDMVTVAGDEITEAIMKEFLTNFATAEKIKMAMSADQKSIEYKDILGNKEKVSANDVFSKIEPAIDNLADAISQRILLINEGAPAAVFLVGGGSQVKNLTKLVADKLGMPENRVALGVVNTDNNLSLFSEELYKPIFVTPIGIGIVSSLYRGCDFFAITVNDKRIMLFNHQTIKVIDALVLSGIKPSSLIGLSAQNLVYMINGKRQVIKGSPGTPGTLEVNGKPATIETPIKQGDAIVAIPAENGQALDVSLQDALGELPLEDVISLEVNRKEISPITEEKLKSIKLNYMDEINIQLKEEPPAREAKPQVEINKIYSEDMDVHANASKVSLVLASDDDYDMGQGDYIPDEDEDDYDHYDGDYEQGPAPSGDSDSGQVEAASEEDTWVKPTIDVILNGLPVKVEQDKPTEPIILMHLLKYVDLDTSQPKGLLVLKINGQDARYADSVNPGDSVIIKWEEDM